MVLEALLSTLENTANLVVLDLSSFMLLATTSSPKSFADSALPIAATDLSFSDLTYSAARAVLEYSTSSNPLSFMNEAH